MSFGAGCPVFYCLNFCGALILRQLKQRSKQPKPAKNSPKPSDPLAMPAPIQPAPALTSRRKWLFRLIALVLVPVLALAGLELVLRLSGCGYPTSLFKNIRIGGKEFVAINEDFSLRFFPPALARWRTPVMMEAKKPPTPAAYSSSANRRPKETRIRLTARRATWKSCCGNGSREKSSR